ncbi:putative deacylase [Bradyrhizobium sp. CIR48]|uniref:hypothetical protein n=1 Tax=Bradyrhizobium sp. CIR48 TaxID=2663840 RepID=UPI00185E67F3|nr:hypothetical protein [Bradyrhizobium sp. CIR48]MBB4423882.1 putative deacylase [Bradyrhizobium sp. CIR48]
MAATLEYRGTTDVSDDLAVKDALGLIGFMEAVRILEPKSKLQQGGDTLHARLECVEYVAASAHRVVIFSKATGQKVAAGEEIAQILDPTTGERTSVTVRSPGIMFGRTGSRIAAPGSTLAAIAGTTPLDSDCADPFP